MQRAIELAGIGLGSASPNPLVGCVIVSDGRIIGEGWHKKYGESHAEVNAIDSVENKSLLSGSTVYVNLEPCSHHGRTPPCAEKLIEVGVKRVVISTGDTNPLVSGKGIALLSNAGIEVITGIMEKEGRRLNRRFFTSIEQQIPYVILKWAETSDGFMASENGEPKWISNLYSRQRAHQWRAQEDAILIGTSTARVDNPRLNVRDWSGRNPLRVVIDRALKLDIHLNVFDQSQPTYCYNLHRQEERPNLFYRQLPLENFLQALLHDLTARQVRSLIVEGGAQTLSHFIQEGYWHEARIFRSSKTFAKGIPAPMVRGKLQSEETLLDDRLSIIMNPLRTTI